MSLTAELRTFLDAIEYETGTRPKTIALPGYAVEHLEAELDARCPNVYGYALGSDGPLTITGCVVQRLSEPVGCEAGEGRAGEGRDATMPIRELTDQESARLLTQSQVDALPDGTSIYVKWSGGNGPHLYITKRSPCGVVAMLPDEYDPYTDAVLHVGANVFNDRVFLPDEEKP